MTQVLEVGAGTGGTSQVVFDALNDYTQGIRYLFTDIGPAFVHSSKLQFAQKYPFTEFMVFDVEKPLEIQGFESNTFDVVLASNVLHTTRRIAVTLEQCRRLLKPGGILVINELTQRLDYNTLTFGLTTGWWLYEDEEIRIKGSPLLRNADWSRMLESVGFRDVNILGVPSGSTEELPQSVIVATNDSA
jgi:ubiquinone/menaquinone biosynthesis C-methylase UbiE